MFYYPIQIEAPDDYTRLTLKRLANGVVSDVSIDLLHRWTYNQCWDWVETYFYGWAIIRATHHAYTPAEKGWVQVPGVVLPKNLDADLFD